jgi:predicted transcriptional regulator
MESFAQILSMGNRELLRVIDEQAPGSLEELAEITGRAKSNLSRTLKKMVSYGLVHMEKDGRRHAPRVIHDRIELDLPLTERAGPRRAAGGRK